MTWNNDMSAAPRDGLEAMAQQAITLLLLLLENDPSEPIADNGMTVLDAVRTDTVTLLKVHAELISGLAKKEPDNAE